MISTPTLYSYCIPVDDGAAPNPYGGICTLNICKPAIRRKADVGDWVVGTGSKNVDGVDYSGKLVYAMKVTKKLSMEDYDLFTQSTLPIKIPKWLSRDNTLMVGDSIYDHSSSPPTLRKGVHSEHNRETDQSGKFTLLSDHFYYFGDQAVDIPMHLLGLVKQGQGHKSLSNKNLAPLFESWIVGQFKKNKLYGKPQIILLDTEKASQCAVTRADYSCDDEIEDFC